MDKETFYESLHRGNDWDDSDHSADELAALLRERRKRTTVNSSLSSRSPMKLGTQRSQTTRRQTAAPHGITEGRLETLGSQQETLMDMNRDKQSSKETAKADGGQNHTKRQRKGTSPRIQDRRRIFKDLVFFFVPNDDISPARRLRIKRSVEFGASRATEWSGSVTHIVVDRGLTAQDVTKCLRIDSLPPNIALVNDTYLAECISNGAILDASHQRFSVDVSMLQSREKTVSARTTQSSPGSLKLKPSHREKENESTPKQSQDSDILPSAQAKSTGKADKAGQKSTSKSNKHTDALDELIETVKATAELPVDVTDEEDNGASRSASEGENSNDSRKRQKISKSTPSWQKSFSCMYKHDGENGKDNPNANTIAILQQMLDYYERTGDQWRCLAYRRAVSALRTEKERIVSKEQALSIRGIGERLASKIEEIVWTNRLRRLEYANLEPNDILLSQFMNVYGAAFAQASKWIAQGYKSLDDLRERATLTANQRVGLDHYDDFLQRIPRTEVEAHGDVVRQCIVRLDPDFQVIIGGSYRRGNPDSRDIDLIITKDGASLSEINELVVSSVVPQLFEQGFLKTHLAVSSRADGSKWHGASALSDNPTWRRIDFLFVPGDELGAALIYFTGNDVFNRSLRLLASKKGMCLNQRGLFANTLRRSDRVKLTARHLLESRDEKRIFELLGVPWRPPHHRIC